MYYTVESTLILTASDLKLMKKQKFLTWLTRKAFPKFGKILLKKLYFKY